VNKQDLIGAVAKRTGKAIHIKASMVPAFRAGRALKDRVNRKRP